LIFTAKAHQHVKAQWDNLVDKNEYQEHLGKFTSDMTDVKIDTAKLQIVKAGSITKFKLTVLLQSDHCYHVSIFATEQLVL